MTDKNKNCVWITGASSGIGKASAMEFSRIGCKVIVSSRRISRLEKINADLKKEKLKVEILPCNVASSANVVQTVKKITLTNKINCLINNAGVSTFKLAKDNSLQEIKDIINTNLLGSIFTIKQILPHMIKNGGGTIINILSVAAIKVFEQSSAYTASKMGLLGYTNVLREEVRGQNIKVVNILPGATETPMWPKEIRNKKSDEMMKPEGLAQLLVWIFLQKRNMVTEEITIRPIQGDI
ncbi:MAG: hypothetical protein CO128_02490 [Ignavibacteriales bacterium CG_4_9_14_3_um_filter_30_11]|nr:MAG: hypothetical protein CO128_02490 [Ignavibacteriales bacterium CG_4_9_14_3_um_filter_30_11]